MSLPYRSPFYGPSVQSAGRSLYSRKLELDYFNNYIARGNSTCLISASGATSSLHLYCLMHIRKSFISYSFFKLESKGWHFRDIQSSIVGRQPGALSAPHLPVQRVGSPGVCRHQQTLLQHLLLSGGSALPSVNTNITSHLSHLSHQRRATLAVCSWGQRNIISLKSLLTDMVLTKLDGCLHAIN